MARTTKRIDPPARSADGTLPYDQLIDADPRMHYVYANPNDEATGVPFYEARGYEPVLYSRDGVKSALGRRAKEGQAITMLGQVLMARPIEEHEAEVARGQLRADAIDRAITASGNLEGGSERNVRLGVDRSVTSGPTTELE